MTAHDIYENAMILAGYVRPDGRICTTPEREIKAVAAINYTSADLGLGIKIASLSDTVEIAERADEALVYGTGMLLALGDGDSEINRILAELYSLKRATAKSKLCRVTDELPCTEGGYI